MNKRQRVASVLETVASLDSETADQVMMAAHTTGRGLVGAFPEKEQATSLCRALRDEDLLVEME